MPVLTTTVCLMQVINPLPEINNPVPLPLNLTKNISLPMFNAIKTYDEAKVPKKPDRAMKVVISALEFL